MHLKIEREGITLNKSEIHMKIFNNQNKVYLQNLLVIHFFITEGEGLFIKAQPTKMCKMYVKKSNYSVLKQLYIVK